MTITALTIAGSDSGGGAGIQADLASFSAHGVHGASAITAITAQNTRAVTAVHTLPPALIEAQIDAVFADIRVHAIKIGMLGSVPMILAVARALERHAGPRGIPVVLDPVMVAKSGDRLLADEAASCLREILLPKASLITPNCPEAAALLGETETQGDCPDQAFDHAFGQARRLQASGAPWVLVKGGHAPGPICRDLLLGPDGHRVFTAPRLATRNTHGTGCSLSSALAARLARGETMPSAMKNAHAWLQGAIRAGINRQIGGGHGPIHHFHAVAHLTGAEVPA